MGGFINLLRGEHMTKQDEAIIKLKAILNLSETEEDFKQIFFEQLHEGKDKQALEIVLSLAYYFLSSEGETLNEVLRNVGEDKANEIRAWLMNAKAKI